MQTLLTQPTISPTGPLESEIVFIGESPSNEELRSGMTLVGSRGSLFDRLLKYSGKTRRDVYITSLFKTQDTSNEGQAQLDLIKELEGLPNLKIIVPLGNKSLKALTGKWSITKWRGSLIRPLRLPTKIVIHTLNPDYCLKGQYKETSLVMFDMMKIKKH